MEEKIQWITAQHRKTNHFYDGYLPYEFHLRMVHAVFNKFFHHVPFASVEGYTLAAWGHDLIEDTRNSYNDVKEVLGECAAELIYAVTNDKGKTRKERAGDKYYEGIQNTDGAVFIKLCDRIANVEYSKMVGSKMFEMYKKENGKFMECIYQPQYQDMFVYLKSLFTNSI